MPRPGSPWSERRRQIGCRAGLLTGTFINVGTVLLGTLIGTLLGSRLPAGLQERVMAGLGLVTLVIGVDLALAWRQTNPLYVLGGVLLGGLVGEAGGIERGLKPSGDRIQRASARGRYSAVGEAFVTDSLLLCFRPSPVVGSIQN